MDFFKTMYLFYVPILGRLAHEDFACCAVGLTDDVDALLRCGELSAVECVSGSDTTVVLCDRGYTCRLRRSIACYGHLSSIDYRAVGRIDEQCDGKDEVRLNCILQRCIGGQAEGVLARGALS